METPSLTADLPQPAKPRGTAVPDRQAPTAVEVREYYPGARRGWGPRVWRELFRETVTSRELTWRLFLRDFSARYRQSVLGVLWAVILPLVAVSTFVLLSRAGLFNPGELSTPYPVFVLLGLTVWQVFAGGLTACSNSIVSGGSMVIKINFPKSTLVFAAMGQVLFELLVRIVLSAIIMAVFRVTPHWTAVFFPLALIPIILFTLGVGFFLALVNVVLRDVGHVVTVLATFLLFLTPVIYGPPTHPLMATVIKYNPLAGLVGAPRDLLLEGQLTDPFAFAWSAALSLVVFLFAWRFFHLVEPRIAERV